MSKKKSKKKGRVASTKFLQKERRKTDLRLSPELVTAVEKISNFLGTTKNAFFSMAATKFAIEVLPLVEKGMPKKQLIDELEAIFNQKLDEARVDL